jgi:ribosomal protein S18 acetylase RimI-like enzyme
LHSFFNTAFQNRFAKISVLNIRAALPLDNQAARELVRSSLNDYAIAAQFDGLDQAIGSIGMPDSGNAIELVAEWQGQLCGCIALQTISNTADNRSAKLFGFHVDHAMRGKGIGKSLLTAMMHAARQHAYQGLQLDTWDNMHAAIKLYETLGWQRDRDPAPESGANRSYLIELRT